jgi:tRNA(Met) cytidine acetyltransferase
MDAHYQSTANDIQRMLDGSDHQIWAYLNAKQEVVGVICTIDEGGAKTFTDNDLRQAISYGARRVQGHMSSQALSQGFNKEALLLFKFCRVHRIAVSPNCQRSGIGSAMLNALHQKQSSLDVDGFTTSFGINASLDRFWHRNGYDIVKIGQRKDTSSGTLTGHYLRTRSIRLAELTEIGKVSLYIDLAYLKHFQTSLYKLICKRIKTLEDNNSIKNDAYAFSYQKAKSFIQNTLSFAMTKSHIYYLACYLNSTQLHQLIEKQHTLHLSKQEKLANIELMRQTLEEELA